MSEPGAIPPAFLYPVFKGLIFFFMADKAENLLNLLPDPGVIGSGLIVLRLFLVDFIFQLIDKDLLSCFVRKRLIFGRLGKPVLILDNGR